MYKGSKGKNKAFQANQTTTERQARGQYYKNPKIYELMTEKVFTTDCPNIHKSGSIKGMENKYDCWKRRIKVKYGDYIYLQPED